MLLPLPPLGPRAETQSLAGGGGEGMGGTQFRRRDRHSGTLGILYYNPSTVCKKYVIKKLCLVTLFKRRLLRVRIGKCLKENVMLQLNKVRVRFFQY